MTMPRVDRRWRVPGLVCLLAAITAITGVLLRGPLAVRAALEHDELLAAPVADAATVRTLPAGTRVLAYGRIDNAAAAAHGLVAFVHQQYEGVETTGPGKGRPRWRELERQTPALRLDIGGGTLAVDAGYALEAALHARAPGGGPVEPLQRFDLRVTDLSTERVLGFAHGDRVTVDGVLALRAGQGTVLQARRLYGGDVVAYRRARSDGAAALPLIGGVFIAVGVALTGLGALLLRRALAARPAGQGAAAGPAT